jgi:HPt (histidine-containing phosphotransfer) domain-containing protein
MPGTETLLANDVFDQIRQAMNADPAGFSELYRDYLKDACETLELLRAMVQRQDHEATFSKAHYLKSSSLVLGVRSVAIRAGELEESARAPAAIEEGAIERIADALREVQTELAARLGAGVIPIAESAA